MKMIIDLPSEVHVELIKLAEKDRRKTKPFVEKVLIAFVERKSKKLRA